MLWDFGQVNTALVDHQATPSQLSPKREGRKKIKRTEQCPPWDAIQTAHKHTNIHVHTTM